jgi:hypothetical protein
MAFQTVKAIVHTLRLGILLSRCGAFESFYQSVQVTPFQRNALKIFQKL